MALINFRTTMTANGTALPLAGSLYELMLWDGYVEFGVFVDTGGSVNGIISSGVDILYPLALLPILAVASPLIYPDHYTLNDVAGRSEKLSVVLQETAAGTPIVRTSVKITRLR